VGDDLLAVRLSHIGSYLFSKNTQLLGEGVEDEFALVDVGVLLLAVFHDSFSEVKVVEQLAGELEDGRVLAVA